jgi:glycosyltransferase involved in cell wall biosynthesis
VPPTVVACNRWTKERARESSLLKDARCEIIPLAVDITVFRPIVRALAREVLGIPGTARVVFCGALHTGQSRKGFASLVEALHKLPHHLDPESLRDHPILLMTAGGGAFANKNDLPFPHHPLGLLGDDRSLALAYSAADLFVSPSIEDAGPMMVNESLACGTPVVAYDIGTAADQVEQGLNGWLARLGESDGLAVGMARILDSSELERMRVHSREVAVANYSPAHVARRYLDLYAELVSEGPR